MEPGKQGEKKKRPAAPSLADQWPSWIDKDGRKGVGISFNCPSCLGQRLAVLFANPIDGGPPLPDDPRQYANNRGRRWTRHGDSFAALTLLPHADGTRPDSALLGHGEDELCSVGGRAHWHGLASAGALL